MRLVRLCLLSLAVLACAVPAASASTTIGFLGTPTGSTCGPNNPLIQGATGVGTNPYTVPTGGGVITAWGTRTGATAGEVKFKVMRLLPGGEFKYLVVAEDVYRKVKANESPEFTGVRIPVQAGDVIGLATTGTNCFAASANPIDRIFSFMPATETPPGSSTGPAAGTPSTLLEITAKVEPDADHDEYGDETQDTCPTSATTHTLPCPLPPPPPPTPDTTAPSLKLSSKAKQTALKKKAVIVVASSSEAANLKASGSVSIPGGSSFSLTPASTNAAANAQVTLSLAIPKEARTKIQKALKEGKKVKASVHVVAKDAAGNTSNANQSITIVKPAAKKHKH